MAFYGMKYDKLTNDYAKWLFNYIDRHDWAETDLRGHYHRNADNEHVLGWMGGGIGYYPPPQITRTHVQKLLNGNVGKLHYLSKRSSDVALVALDIDEHHGEGDSFDAAVF